MLKHQTIIINIEKKNYVVNKFIWKNICLKSIEVHKIISEQCSCFTNIFIRYKLHEEDQHELFNVLLKSHWICDSKNVSYIKCSFKISLKLKAIKSESLNIMQNLWSKRY